MENREKKLSPLVEALIKKSVEKNLSDNNKIIIEEVSSNVLNGVKNITQYTTSNRRYKNTLDKTLEILETYKILQEHIKNEEKNNLTVEALKNAEKEKIENFMIASFVEDIEELNYEKLFKQTKETKIFLEVITNIFNDYIEYLQKNKNGKNKEKNERKIKILKDYYMEGKPLSEITVMYENERSFYYDKDEIVKELAPRLYGIYGVNFMD